MYPRHCRRQYPDLEGVADIDVRTGDEEEEESETVAVGRSVD